MDFDSFCKNAWTEHADKPSEVADRLPQGLALITAATQIAPFTNLAMHVLCEHLGRWDEAAKFLTLIETKPIDDPDHLRATVISRFQRALALARNEKAPIDEKDPGERVRVRSLAAGWQSAHGQSQAAMKLLQQAMDEARGLEENHPAIRQLAITGNNVASAMSEKKDLQPADRDLMIAAAKAGREFWARAGGWLEVERAEYRLALSWLAAGDTGRALIHARNGLQICESQNADALEFFFFQEVFTRIHHADGDPDSARRASKLMNQHFEKISAADQSWCRDTLLQIAKLLEERP